jgi:hypothetical protein
VTADEIRVQAIRVSFSTKTDMMPSIQADPLEPMNLVFWQSILSPHQSAPIRALAELPSVSVTMVGMEIMSPERVALGWTTPCFGKATAVESPTFEEVGRIIEENGPACVHLLSGWRGLRMGWELLRELEKRSARIGLVFECPDPRGWKGLLRRACYLKDHLVHGRHADLILAMGEQGVAWFRQSGYAAAKLFPYAYITERPYATPKISDASEPFDLLYLGSFLELKGMGLAFRALAALNDLNWRLTLIGTGSETNRWKSQCAALGITARVRFLQAMPNAPAMTYLAVSDALLLPSKKDGWGAVVNEALMMGVPVICSNRCGAKDLIAESWRGEVFKSNSLDSLYAALKRRIAGGKRTADMTKRIIKWSRCLEGDPAAVYLVDVLKHVYSGGPRPRPPWASNPACAAQAS